MKFKRIRTLSKCEKIVIVTGYEGEKLKTFLSRLDISTPVEYVEDVYKRQVLTVVATVITPYFKFHGHQGTHHHQ